VARLIKPLTVTQINNAKPRCPEISLKVARERRDEARKMLAQGIVWQRRCR